jgi:disulfide bond formation protein DsbB
MTMSGMSSTGATSTGRQAIMVAALLVAIGGAATILGAYFFQYVLKYPPCPLCLDQRIPYYIAIPLSVLIAISAGRAPRALLLAGLGVVALTMLIGAGLGAYHSGIEWKWWPGPADCSGPLDNLGTSGGVLGQLQSINVVRCDEAAWRFLGLSLAGYNVLISLVLSAIALCGILTAKRWSDGVRGYYGSSSVSQ